jgi:hypothetical protein
MNGLTQAFPGSSATRSPPINEQRALDREVRRISPLGKAKGKVKRKINATKVQYVFTSSN